MFEEEVRNHNPHILSDSEMDTMLKDNLIMWLQIKVFY